jgi:uncharacterized Tic20 family protein
MAAPQPDPQDRTIAALVHLSIFLNLLVFPSGLIVSLVVALLYRDRSPFVARHAFQSLMFQLCLGIAAIVALAFLAAVWVGVLVAWVPWMAAAPVVPRGMPAPGAAPWVIGVLIWALSGLSALTAAAFLALATIFPFIAALRANRGEDFDYPLTGRLVPHWWHSSGA